MRKQVAVILAGCGYMDGAEIREAVLTYLELERHGLSYDTFAPNSDQQVVMNHLTKQEMNEKRNVLVESARIARGNIKKLDELNPDNYQALIMPGGYGVATNLSNIGSKGVEGVVFPTVVKILTGFWQAKKPIGVICFSPVVLACALGNVVKDIKVTIGDDNDGMIKAFGCMHETKQADEICFDEKNKILSCSAYMRDDPLPKIADGIKKLVEKMSSLI